MVLVAGKQSKLGTNLPKHHHPTETTGIGSHKNDWPKEGSEQVAKSFPVCVCVIVRVLLYKTY